MKLIKNDSYLSGLLLAIILPLLSAVLVVPAGRAVLYMSKNMTFFDSNLLLLCLIPNLLFMRYYIVRINFEKTGRGILILTVAMMAAYFIFAHGHPFNVPFGA